jgi:hypothetical protein
VNRAKIILLCIAAAVTYGVLHDQVTARLCVEYFTVAHPPIFSATSPTIIALCWGVAATAGIGTILGVLLALVAHAGNESALSASRLIRPVIRLLFTMALAALAAGACGYWLARRGVIPIPTVFADSIPRVHHDAFMAVWFAHGASYLIGLGGGMYLMFCVWRSRGKPMVLSLFPRTRGAALRAVVIIGVAAYVLWIRFGTH